MIDSPGNIFVKVTKGEFFFLRKRNFGGYMKWKWEFWVLCCELGVAFDFVIF